MYRVVGQLVDKYQLAELWKNKKLEAKICSLREKKIYQKMKLFNDVANCGCRFLSQNWGNFENLVGPTELFYYRI